MIEFLAFTARDKAVRREAATRGRAYLGLGPDLKHRFRPELVGNLLDVAAEEGGAPVFDALLATVTAEVRELERRRLLAALGSVAEPGLAARARALELDPRVHPNEVGRILGAQLRRPATRDAAWAFFVENLDKLIARMPAASASGLVATGSAFCDRAHRDELEKLFTPRIAALEGGPRSLAGALEEMSLCIARRAAHEPGAQTFFATRKR